MTFLPSASFLFQGTMSMSMYSSACSWFRLVLPEDRRKSGTDVSLAVVEGNKLPSVPAPRAKPRLVCLPEQGRHGGMRHPRIDSRRHIIHTTTNELLQRSFPLQPAWQTTASRHRTNAPQHANPGKRYVRYLNLENWRRHCRPAPCLGSAPAKLNLSSRRRPSFWLPLFPVHLGWE